MIEGGSAGLCCGILTAAARDDRLYQQAIMFRSALSQNS